MAQETEKSCELCVSRECDLSGRKYLFCTKCDDYVERPQPEQLAVERAWREYLHFRLGEINCTEPHERDYKDGFTSSEPHWRAKVVEEVKKIISSKDIEMTQKGRTQVMTELDSLKESEAKDES